MRRGLKVAYLVRSWPRLSQTFILNEVLELERRGVRLAIFALARSGDPVVQPGVGEVQAPVTFLDRLRRRRLAAHLRLAAHDARRYLSTLVYALRRRRLYGGYTRSGPLRAFDAAVRVAAELIQARADPFTHLHAHFAHDPALIALLAHRLTGVPFSFTAHARDLYQIPERALEERARQASTVITCCRANEEHIRRVARPPAAVELIYHGVDLRSFTPRDRGDGHGVPLVLSVGRLVEKKGFDDLLAACAAVAAGGFPFRCEIYGDGPEREHLEALRDRLGLGDVVDFAGVRTQHELVSAYRRADVFALTPRVTHDGDRDGVPNVLLEAMACGAPVVATRVGGVAEVVHHQEDGMLVDERDPDAVAGAIARLLDDRALRERWGARAARTAMAFDDRLAAERLIQIFSRGAGSA